MNSDDVMAVTEGFIKKVFKEVLDKDVVLPLKRLTYNEAMTRFGSDKPDLRFGMELVNLTELLKNSEFDAISLNLRFFQVRLLPVDQFVR